MTPVVPGNPDAFGSVGMVTGLPDPDPPATVIVDVGPVTGNPDLVALGGPMALMAGAAIMAVVLAATGTPVIDRMSVGNIH